MNDRIENTILNSLFFNEDFVRKAIPFIKPHFFSKRDERLLFMEVDKFVQKYNNPYAEKRSSKSSREMKPSLLLSNTLKAAMTFSLLLSTLLSMQILC